MVKFSELNEKKTKVDLLSTMLNESEDDTNNTSSSDSSSSESTSSVCSSSDSTISESMSTASECANVKKKYNNKKTTKKTNTKKPVCEVKSTNKTEKCKRGKRGKRGYPGYILPNGVIMIWSGAENYVPKGWAICNGQTYNGYTTPDLRGRFVLAAGQGTNLTNRIRNETGGAETVTLSLDEMPTHNHIAGNTTTVQTTTDGTHTHVASAANNGTHTHTQ